MHLFWIMDKACLYGLSNCKFLSKHFCHLFPCSTLISPSKTMGKMCWILYSTPINLWFRLAKDILDLSDMVGYPSMICSSRNPFWNCRDSDIRGYYWSLLFVENWCSSYTYRVSSDLGIVTVLLFCNFLILLCPYIVLTWYFSFSHVVLISPAGDFFCIQRHCCLCQYTFHYV